MYLKYSKGIRGLKYIIIFLLFIFWIFYAVPVILLHIPYVQQKIAHTASKELSEYLRVPVKVGKVDFEWFHSIVLEDLYLEDQHKSVLFKANHVSAGFELLPALKGKFVFTTVRLFGFDLHLKKATPQEKLNLQFIIDAFASKDSVKKETNVDLKFNSVLVRKGNVSFDVSSTPETPGKFNGKHVAIKNISAKISIKAFNKDSINASIKKLSFTEKSGFELNKLTLNLTANKDSASIQNFEVKLPQTALKIDRANVDLTQVDSIGQLVDNAKLTLRIAPSEVCLKDLASFVPAFQNFADIIEMSAEVSGSVDNIDLKRLTVKYSDKMLFLGKMELKGITHPEEAYVFGQVNKMYLTTGGIQGLANNFSSKPVVLPREIVKLGTINFTGEISGFFDNLVAFGRLSSAIGAIQTDLIFGRNKSKGIDTYLKGHMATSGLKINELFDAGNPYGNVAFDITLDSQRPVNGNFSGNVKALVTEVDFKGYTYKNVNLTGNFKKNGFNGMIKVDDPNGTLYAEGLFEHRGKNSVFNFVADLKSFRPDKLHLTNAYDSPEISGTLKADFTGNTIDNVEGNIRIDSLLFKTAPSEFFINKFQIAASGHSLDRRLTITSDVINGEINGSYSFETIIPSLMNTFKGYLPALIKATQKEKKTKENNFSLLLTIENTDSISKTLKLPVTIVNQSRIVGHYNNKYNKFRVEAFLPGFKVGASAFESGYMVCDNPTDEIVLHVKATNFNNKGLKNYLDLSLNAKNDRINSLISWANNKSKTFKADLSSSTHFVMQEQETGPAKLRTEIELNQSPIIVNDSLWQIEPSNIFIENGRIMIDNFYAYHDDQFIRLDGDVSKTPTDTLKLDLKDVELSYIFDIVNIPVLQFGGKATGTFNLNDLYGSRVLNTDLEIENFSFNKVPFGKLNLYSEWDDQQQGIMMLGSIYKNDSTWTDINGFIYPVGEKSGLSLYFDANDIDISFLQPFMQNIAKNIKGSGFGNVHLFGPFSKLTVEGEALIKDGGLGIDYLNTYYTFTDSIHLTPETIRVKDLTLYDKDGNKGKVNGEVNHQFFRDFNFKATVQADNMLLYNATPRQNPQISGTAYGSGSATIQGNEQLINFDINMRSNPGTSIALNFMEGSKAMEYDFINFVEKDTIATDSKGSSLSSEKKQNSSGGAEYRMNFLLDLTPDAQIELVMDPVSGDKIKGYGNGNMQIQYGTKTDLRMYGAYSIESGSYNFSLQQVIQKDFKLREGSTVSFRGDPFDANLDINAIYSLTANLGDLDESLAQESARTNVPVNCVLNLNGVLRSPTISFDLELPNSNEELERKMRSLVDTEEMMTRQVVYLLVLNKFYTPDYAMVSSTTSGFASVASSAISSQLSNILSSITDKVQIGTNIRASESSFTDTEVEMMLSSQLLDNRLLFNGNFGYKNNPTQPRTFVGEFDLEYKLNKSGEIRLKAYNHSNDMYKYLKSALTTQGVGIMFKKDFDRLGDIFRKRRRYQLIPVDSTQNTSN